MSQGIPIVGPREAKLLFRYFVAVDRCLASRFKLGFAPDEEHLTSLLTELLDSRGSMLHPLGYSLAQLNEDLRAAESLLQIELSITANKYNRHQESRVTQADLGLILDYRDHVRHDRSFQKAALFQAKRLFPDTKGVYGLASEYKAYRLEQHRAFETLELDESVLGEPMRRHRGSHGRCYYLLYNPSLAIFAERDQDRVRYQQVQADAESIFDYTRGLHLYSEMLGQDPIQAFSDLAAMVCSLDALTPPENSSVSAVPTFDSVFEERSLRQSSLPWFLVFEFMAGGAGSSDSDFLQIVWCGGSARRQEDARIEFIAPRYSLNLKVHGGKDPENTNSHA